MSNDEPTALESAVNDDDRTELEERDVRALTQYLSVLDDIGRARSDDNLFLVVSQSGEEYLVNTRGSGSCDCPDAEYRGIRCKHQRRVAFATGERTIPAAVDDVDPQLGEHVNTNRTQVAATDGGQIIVAGDDGEILGDEPRVERSEVGVEADSSNDDRPDDCQCWDPDGDLACWPCYNAGFEEPNPDVVGRVIE